MATYVPGVPALEGITLAQLCNSTSGLAPYLPAVFGRIIATLHPRDEEAGAPGLEAAFDDADDVRR